MAFVILDIIILIFGIVLAFWGYKLRRIYQFILGLLTGLLTGGAAGLFMIGTGGAVVMGLILGILFGIIGIVWEKVAVFIEFFDYGFVLTALLLGRTALSSWDSITNMALSGVSGIITSIVVPAVIVGCIAGVIGLFIFRAWIIFSTAFWGGVLCTITLVPFLHIFAVVGILIIPAGIIYQLKTTGISLKKDAAEQAAPLPVQQMRPNVELPGDLQKVQTAEQAGSAEIFCSRCGSRIGTNVKFCSKCGNKVR